MDGGVVTGTGLLHGPYAALLPALLAEGPVATVAGGALVGAGHAAFVAVWLLAFGTDLVLDSGLFLLGRLTRRAGRVGRLGRGAAALAGRLGLTADRREALAARATDHLPALVAGAKLVDVGAVPAFLAAGWSGVPYRRFAGWVAACTALRVSVLLGLGLLAGDRLAATGPGLVADVLATPWLTVLVGVAVGVLVLAGRTVVRAALRSVREGGGLLAASFAL
ncbi:hypothetical protein [Kineococcus sp. NPDC059986]|jgi:membrane protein DedA with SNARE-associated domain|uniref:hypothetical protein n=1 Tax=Kineococcus sp. NPDC059986 TaxID=3155538 RepID=UPI00344E0B43